MIKNLLVTGSNRMDRFLGSASPRSSGNMNELWEEDLWPVDTEEDDLESVQDRKDDNSGRGKFVIHSTGIRGMIPRVGGFSSDAGLRQHHQSAPVNVPDWSKILGVDHRKDQNPYAVDVDMAGDEDEEEEEERLPPHEYLAREHARCRISTPSFVLEGVGLKGRDMSRVRNAVWRQTGFLG